MKRILNLFLIISFFLTCFILNFPIKNVRADKYNKNDEKTIEEGKVRIIEGKNERMRGQMVWKGGTEERRPEGSTR